MTLSERIRQPGPLLLLVSAVVFLVLTLQQSSAPYVIDEAAFPYAGAAVANTGRPVFYNGETRPNDVAIWHPPLYVFALGAWESVAGSSHSAVRLFGIGCALASAVLVFVAAAKLLRSPGRIRAGIAASIFLVNPLTISGSLVPDIDGTLGLLSLVLCLWAVTQIVVARSIDRGKVLLLVAVFGIAFSTKLTTSMGLVPVLVGGVFWTKESLRKKLTVIVGVLTSGFALFCGWWFVVARLTSTDFAFPFRFTWQSFGKRGGADRGLARLLQDGFSPDHRVLFFLQPLLLVAAGLGVVLVMLRRDRRELVGILLWAGFGFGVIVAYDMITGPVFTYPKYWVAAIPGLSMAAASAYKGGYGESNTSRRLAAGLIPAAAVSCVFASALFRRHLYPQPERAWVWSFRALLLVGGLVLVGIVAGSVFARARPRVHVAGITVLVATLLTTSVAEAAALRSAPFSTRYYFGERGLDRLLFRLRMVAEDSDLILAPKDIGLESGNPFLEDAQLFYGVPAASLMETLRQQGVKWIVTRRKFDYSEAVFPKQFDEIRGGSEAVYDDPRVDFVIWRVLG